jgi:acyl-CoA dehydrogenase
MCSLIFGLATLVFVNQLGGDLEVTPGSELSNRDPALEDFRRLARSFLAASAVSKSGRADEDEVAITLFEPADDERDRLALVEARKWQALKFDHGFGWLSGPTGFGGGGLGPEYQIAWDALECQYDVPSAGNLHMGLTTVGPTIAEFGTSEQKARYLPALYRGDLLGCQLFSEPGAGSDLAGLATRAERLGDGWAVTGQKVWTSAAQHGDFGEIICRTDPDAPKHKGLTAFLLDLRAPGVTVRPLRQMTGGESFNEVFLDGVRVPDTDRLGAEGQGWAVVMFSLDAERATIRNGPLADPDHLHRVLSLSDRVGRSKDPADRQVLADLIIRDRVAELLGRRLQGQTQEASAAELALTKLAIGANHARRAEVVCRLLGPQLQARSSPEWAWTDFVLSTPAITIAGGTDQVLRNLIGERILGMPKEPGLDPRTAFKDLPR